MFTPTKEHRGTTRTSSPLILSTALLLLGGALACSDDGGDNRHDASVSDAAVLITISGNHSVQVGATLSLNATTTNGQDSSYSWSSGDDNVATVTDGTVTGVAPGEILITATGDQSGASATHAVVVAAKPQTGEAVVKVSGAFYLQTNATTQLTATTVNGTDSAYSWSSSDEAVATVAADGTVTGVAPGQVTITATGDDSGVSGMLGLNVANEIPNLTAWKTSAHADTKAEAFNHWNEDDPAVVETECARCHSTPGYRDFIGDDGSAVGSVETAPPVGTVVECTACHNATASALASATFPSGVTIDGLGPEARCMTCHQGRSSTDDVDEAIADAGATDPDVVNSSLGFLNIHYFFAGATINGGRVRGGYQYEGKHYDWRFRHVPGKDSCTGCHDPHSLKVKIDECAACHPGVTTGQDLRQIRMMASLTSDYDGDGDLTEGIDGEIQGLRAKLLTALQSYASEQSLAAICYAGSSYPYFFKDTNGNGSCESGEATFSNGYDSWTPRLLRGAYNYQVSTKDPGAFAHNGKYLVQLLFDSISDINTVLTSKVDMDQAKRNNPGHFDGSAEAARHWDEDDAVSSSCSRCHGGATGFRFYLTHGVGTGSAEQGNGLDCATCHETFGSSYAVVAVDSVTYPSGVTIEDEGNGSNVCATCHSGRESMATIDKKIAANEYEFRNVHYLPAAAVKAGVTAHVGYEYSGKTYAGPWNHVGGNNCTSCHDPVKTKHTFDVADNFSTCTATCHSSATNLGDIRRAARTADYDGDNDNTEPLADEITTIAERLLAAIVVAAGTTNKICYGSHHPYFVNDTDGDGICDESEVVHSNAYSHFTPALMRAAHNYQISQKDPGAWAHNFDYMVQLLYDSIEDLGGDLNGLVRP